MPAPIQIFQCPPTHLKRRINFIAAATMLLLGACATQPPPPASSASIRGLQHIAVVNISAKEPLMMGQRYDPSGANQNGANPTRSVPRQGNLFELLALPLGAAWANNRAEFNDRAPKGLAPQLQKKFTESVQVELKALRLDATLVDVEPPKRDTENYTRLLADSIRAKCATCDSVLMLNTSFGYNVGNTVLNPAAESTFFVVRLADAVITGYTPFLIHRDFANDPVGHRNYNEFRQDKRDHYAPLEDLPAPMARAVIKELRQSL